MTNPQPYDLAYYSDKHIAFTKGYTLETRREKYSDVIENICKYLGEPLLDIGCGPGYLVHILREKKFAAYGCDFSNSAMKLVPSITRQYIARCDIRRLEYKDLEFSSCTAFHVLEHLQEDEVGSAIAEIFRVTRERFYGFIPTTDGIAERDGIVRDQIINDPTHLTMKDRGWWL